MKVFYEDLNKANKAFHKSYMKGLDSLNFKGSYILGKNVNDFEKNFARYLGVNHCVGVANGLDALTISLKAIDLPKNSEVMVASNSYIACIISIINAGYKPILIEPDLETYNISATEIKNITNKTKAILAVHLYGKSCDMDEIIKICKKKFIFN